MTIGVIQRVAFNLGVIPRVVDPVSYTHLINAINLTNVKVFGEMEFWFAIIKVVAVVAIDVYKRQGTPHRGCCNVLR